MLWVTAHFSTRNYHDIKCLVWKDKKTEVFLSLDDWWLFPVSQWFWDDAKTKGSRTATCRQTNWHVQNTLLELWRLKKVLTWYVSHNLMVQCNGTSLISKLFIQRKANCKYFTSCWSKCLWICSEDRINRHFTATFLKSLKIKCSVWKNKILLRSQANKMWWYRQTLTTEWKSPK